MSTADLEATASAWITAVLREELPGPTLAASLKDGVILCRLINILRAGSVPKYSPTPSNASKRMENVTLFIRAARELGMREHELFSTVDLVEEKDMRVVVMSLTALGRLCATAKWATAGLPSLSARGVLISPEKAPGAAVVLPLAPKVSEAVATDSPGALAPVKEVLLPAATTTSASSLLADAIARGKDALCDPSLHASLDAADELAHLSKSFLFPSTPASAKLRAPGVRSAYLCGNSLGLQPASVRGAVNSELDKWASHAVEGHFTALPGSPPWVSAGETARSSTARIVGANVDEVVIMNALTVNLHALMLAFYRPEGKRTRILYEAGAFPSDAHVILSQALMHKLDPKDVSLRLSPRTNETLLREEDILKAIADAGDTLALVMLPGVQYYTGQAFRIREITAAAHSVGAIAGWDLAHAVGNIPLSLHEDGVDFAAWCTYKYLNSGPGGIGGAFVHSRFSTEDIIRRPRPAGWWGARASDRFVMAETYSPEEGAAAYALSNPPVLLVASLKASLDVFDEAGGVSVCRKKSLTLTRYLEALIDALLPGVSIITSRDPDLRGAQLSLTMPEGAKSLKSVHERLSQEGIYVDTREPSVLRVAPAPLYNSAKDVFEFVTSLAAILAE